MIDWKSVPAADRQLSDTALAEKLNTSRQNVSLARKRLGWPPSPESRGGDRKSAGRTGNTLRLDGIAQKRARWQKAADKAHLTLTAWIIAAADSAARAK